MNHLFDWKPPRRIFVYDHPLRVFVPSDTEEEPHLVDLSELGGAGICSCSEYHHRDEGTRCHHIRKAKDWLRRGPVFKRT